MVQLRFDTAVEPTEDANAPTILMNTNREELWRKDVPHGLEFDSEGRCTLIPWEGDAPEKCGVIQTRLYPTEELGGFVWSYIVPAVARIRREEIGMKQLETIIVALTVMLAVALGISSPVRGEDFYKDKFMTFIVGYSPGGSFDAYTRLLARHMPDHIPGQPKAVVQNMTGAGGLIAANYVYNRAQRDGRTIGGWGGALVLQNVLGRETTKFDGRKFGWLGTPAPYNTVCSFNRQSGIKSVADWFASKKPLTIAGFGAGSTPSDVPKLLHAALGLPLKVIEGYRGGAKARLAVEMGEVDGYCGSWQTVKSIWREAFDKGNIRVVIQTTLKSHPELEDVPLAIDYAKTDEARQLLKILDYAYSAPFKYSVPPDVPRDRLEILQKAFVEALRDPKLLATAKRSQMEIDPVGGPETARIIEELYDMKAATKARLQDILLPKRQN